MGWFRDFTRSAHDFGYSARKRRHERRDTRARYAALMANMPNALGMNYENLTDEQRLRIRDFYMKPGTANWQEGPTSEIWFQNNRINPETGMLEGDFPFVPHQYARQIQMEADLATEGLRRRYMQGGVDFMLGATDLMESYRPGGSAALEANIYGQTAGLMFDRARMTQPLDYMSDLRRHEQAQIERRNRRAADRAMWTQIGTTAASLVAGYFGGPVAAGAVQGIGQAVAGNQQAQGSYGTISASGMEAVQRAQNQQQSAGTSTYSSTYSPSISTQGASGITPQAPAQSGGMVAPGGTDMMGSGGGGQALAAGLESEGAGGMPAGQGMPAGPGVGAPAGGGMPAEGGGLPPGTAGAMVAGGLLGADGQMSPQSVTAGAMAMGPNAPLETAGERMALLNYVADQYDSDPFYASFPAAIDQVYKDLLDVQGAV